MITPSFRCRQDRGFVIVEIYLPSIHCKISNAEFDITSFQFTFHCSPYYLRLQFQSKAEIGSANAATSLISPTAAAGKPQGLCEGKGERATYDLATSTMTVYLPKAVDGEIFLYLDMPNLLLATHQQRKALLKPAIEVLQSTSQDDDGVMLPASEAEEKRLKEAKGGKKTSPEDDDAAVGAEDAEDEWEDEEEEVEDDEVEVEDELETEFVQMQISGQEGLSFKRAGGEGASDDAEDKETKMAVKTTGTDASLLTLEDKLGAKKEAVVDANGWFRGGAAAELPEDASSSPNMIGVLLAGGSTAASKSVATTVLLTDRGYGFNKEFTNVFAIMSKTDAQQNTNYVGEVVDVKNPDEKSRLDRRQERLMRETEDYDDEAFWGCVNEDLRDPNSELGELFAILMAPKGHGGGGGAAKRFVPWYVDAFETQLASSGMAFVSATSPLLSNRATTAEDAAVSLYTPSAIPRLAVEEDGEDYGTANIQSSTKGVIVAWEGNAGTVIDNPNANRGLGVGVGAAGERKGPLVSEIFAENERLLAATAADAAAAGAEDSAAGVVLASRPVVATSTLSTRVANHQNSAGLVGSPTAAVSSEQRPLRLAIPTVPPSIAFTKEEVQLLLHIQPRPSPITPIPSNASEVCALLVDLLCAFVFDYLTTLGDGSVESVWTVTRLSPSLSYLDEPRNVYEALVGFARRAFIYPYLRHWALVHRVTRDVGIILLSGPQAVIKALLGLKHVLDNTEHHHMLTKLYVNPMIGYLSGCLRDETDAAAIAATLQRTALEIHRSMTFEPSQEVASGTVTPPHIIDMLCDGMEGYADVVEDSAVKAAADAAALSAAEDEATPINSNSTTGNSGSRGRGLVLDMLKSSAEKQKCTQTDEQKKGSDICRKYGAIQYEPLAPFTLGLPIDMEEEGDE